MASKNKSIHPILFFSAGIFLQILPVRIDLIFFQPRWVLVLFLLSYFYSLNLYRFIYLYAFVSGLFLDVIYGSPLGQHIFGMILIAFLLLKSHRMIEQAPLIQLVIILASFMLIFELAMLVVDGFVGILNLEIKDRFILAITSCFWWFGLYLTFSQLNYKKSN